MRIKLLVKITLGVAILGGSAVVAEEEQNWRQFKYDARNSGNPAERAVEPPLGLLAVGFSEAEAGFPGQPVERHGLGQLPFQAIPGQTGVPGCRHYLSYGRMIRSQDYAPAGALRLILRGKMGSSWKRLSAPGSVTPPNSVTAIGSSPCLPRKVGSIGSTRNVLAEDQNHGQMLQDL